MSKHPQVTLQVLPFETGPHQGLQDGFQCLDFNAPNDPGVIYLETGRGGLYLEEEDDVSEYRSIFSSLESAALNPPRSVSMIKKLTRELT